MTSTMPDKTEQDNGSLTEQEWAEELESFLGSEDSVDKSVRQQKQIVLESIAKQMLENPEENNGEAGKVLAVPKMETKPCKTSQSRCFLYFVLLCIISFGLIKYGYCQGKSLKLCWNNNIQDWIYPILRAIRLLALPVIQYFPSISDMHEETCLVENPLYWDQEVDCTLCQQVGVVTLSDAHQFEELFYHKGVPVVIQDAVPEPVSPPALHHLYSQHREDIAAGSAGRLQPVVPGLDSLDRLLATPERQLTDMPGCVQWRLLRVSAVRHLRQLFVRPYFISKKTEVSLHRYIYICGDQGERFPLPMTEFANVWISQHSGTRQILLAPSSECSAICRPVSALLRPGETLFYNWRYWRASSLPVDAGLLRKMDTSSSERYQSVVSSPSESRESDDIWPAESRDSSPTQGQEPEDTSPAGSQESEVTPLAGSQESEVTPLAGSQESEVTPLAESQESHVTPLTESQESHVTPLAESKESHVTPLAGSQESEDTCSSCGLDGWPTSEDGREVPIGGDGVAAGHLTADTDYCAQSAEVSPSSPDPTAGITFVGSFY